MSAISGREPVLLDVTLKYASAEEFERGFAPNLSALAVFLKTKQPKPVGTPVRVQLHLRSGAVVLCGEGRVQWSHPGDAAPPGRQPGMGIAFTPDGEESQARVRRMLERSGEGQAAMLPGTRLKLPPGTPLAAPAKPVSATTDPARKQRTPPRPASGRPRQIPGGDDDLGSALGDAFAAITTADAIPVATPVRSPAKPPPLPARSKPAPRPREEPEWLDTADIELLDADSAPPAAASTDAAPPAPVLTTDLPPPGAAQGISHEITPGPADREPASERELAVAAEAAAAPGSAEAPAEARGDEEGQPAVALPPALAREAGTEAPIEEAPDGELESATPLPGEAPDADAGPALEAKRDERSTFDAAPTVAEPAADAEPVAETEPGTEAEPPVELEPAAADDPTIRAELTAEAEPPASAEAIPHVAPGGDAEHAADAAGAELPLASELTPVDAQAAPAPPAMAPPPLRPQERVAAGLAPDIAGQRVGELDPDRLHGRIALGPSGVSAYCPEIRGWYWIVGSELAEPFAPQPLQWPAQGTKRPISKIPPMLEDDLWSRLTDEQAPTDWTVKVLEASPGVLAADADLPLPLKSLAAAQSLESPGEAPADSAGASEATPASPAGADSTAEVFATSSTGELERMERSGQELPPPRDVPVDDGEFLSWGEEVFTLGERTAEAAGEASSGDTPLAPDTAEQLPLTLDDSGASDDGGGSGSTALSASRDEAEEDAVAEPTQPGTPSPFALEDAAIATAEHAPPSPWDVPAASREALEASSSDDTTPGVLSPFAENLEEPPVSTLVTPADEREPEPFAALLAGTQPGAAAVEDDEVVAGDAPRGPSDDVEALDVSATPAAAESAREAQGFDLGDDVIATKPAAATPAPPGPDAEPAPPPAAGVFGKLKRLFGGGS